MDVFAAPEAEGPATPAEVFAADPAEDGSSREMVGAMAPETV